MAECQKNIKRLLVVAAIITKDNKYLITQHSEKMRFPGLWEFPGGKVKQNELPENALIREIYEELGLNIKIKNKALEWKYNYDFAKIDFIAFFANPVSGKICLNEHSSFNWVELNELRLYDMLPADKELQDFLIGKFLEE